MSNDEEKVELSFEEAVAMLPEGDRIHTFRQGGPALIGADWDREEILALFEKHTPGLSGPSATVMKHGIVVIDDTGPLFVETKSQ